MVQAPEVQARAARIGLEIWLKVGILAAVLVWINRHQFSWLVRKWIDDDNWSHGFLIPLFSVFLLYMRWGELRSARRRTSLWGLPVLLVVVVLEILAYNDGNRWACLVGMLLVAFGLVFYLAGPDILRLLWLPILYLFFAIPLSDYIYGQIALPLQNAAATASATILSLFGVDIVAEQSNLTVFSLSGVKHSLTVEEACSGMRLLMAFVALSVAMAYLTDRPLWQRMVLVAVGVPIAIACNILRVTMTCLAYVIDREQLGQDFMHDFAGVLMLVPAMGMLWLLGWLLRHLIIDEPDEAVAEA